MAKNKVSIEIELLDRISGNLDRVNRKMDELGRQSQQARRELNSLDGVSDKLKRSLATLGAAFSVKELVGKVVSVRGEMQQLQVAFETMLGSGEKASALMAQLVHTAAVTPFGLEDVSNGARQLLAYGTEAEKVNETLIKLGDIAAGLSMPLNDLVYLYGTTMTQGRLYTQDLNQFTGRGIPMIQELAKQFGVAESEVKGLVEAGKVGFPEVEKVINSLTGEGSKFGGLMEEQSKTITGQIANIEDAIDMMFNDIGQQSEGVINGALQSVSYVVEHYEQFGRMLVGVAATWGAYRAAVMLAAAAEGYATAAEAAHAIALGVTQKAQALLNATMMANPYVLVTTAVVGLVTVLASMQTAEERVNEVMAEYDAEKQKVIEAEEDHRRRIEQLTQVAGEESASTETRRAALVELIQQYPAVFAKYKTETEMLAHIRDIKLEIAELDGKKSVTNARNEAKTLGQTVGEIRKELESRKTGSSVQGVEKYKGVSTTKLQDMLKGYSGRLQSLNEQVRKDSANTYMENLTGISNQTLQAQIKARKDLLSQMTLSGKKNGMLTGGPGAMNGVWSRSELEGQLQLLQAEQNRRTAPRKTNATRGSEARKAYQKALKEYNDFIGDGSKKLEDGEAAKQAKALKEKVDSAKKEYEKYKPVTDKDSEKANRAANKEAAAEEKRKAAKEKLGQELVALETENQAAEIAAMADGTEKKLKEIENDYQKQKAAIAKQEADWKRENVKAGVKTGESGLTEEQSAALGEARTQAEKKYAKERADAVRDGLEQEQAAMREYLMQYGTFREQKLAIEKEYAQKTAEVDRSGASDEEKKWTKMSLEKEKQSRLAQVDQSALQAQIDWKSVFGTMTTVLRDELEQILRGLESYTGTEEFRQRSGDDQTKIYEQIDKLREELGESSGTLAFGNLQQKVNAAAVAINNMQMTARMCDSAFAQLQEAQKEYEEALKTGNVEAVQAARDEVSKRQQAYESVKRISEQSAQNAQQASRESNQAVTDTVAGIEGTADALSRMASGSLRESFEGFKDLASSLDKLDIGGAVGDTIGKLSDSLSNSGCIGAIISAILKLLDVFKEEGLGGLISGLIDSILGAIDGILDNILSGKFISQIVGSIVKGIGNILDTVLGAIGSVLSFGALSSDGPGSWFTNSNAKEVAETTERLTEENERLRESVDNLKDEMANQGGTKALTTYSEAVKNQQRIQDNTMEILKAQMGYHGAHHSNAYYWGLGDSDYAELNRLLAEYAAKNPNDSKSTQKSVYSLEDIYKLTPEQMDYIRTYNVDMWNKMLDEGKYDKSEYWDAYADLAGEMEDILEAFQESLTQVSFDSLRSSFIDTLMDMDASAEDFAEDFEEYLMRSVLNAKISELLDDELEAFYKKWADYAASDNTLTEAEIEELQKIWDGLTEKGLQLRDEASKITGYTGDSSTTQSGKTGTFTTMTQDQGTKLEGLFTSGLRHWASMDEKLVSVADRMATAESHLVEIAQNTGQSASGVAELKEEFRKMLKDGLKVR